MKSLFLLIVLTLLANTFLFSQTEKLKDGKVDISKIPQENLEKKLTVKENKVTIKTPVLKKGSTKKTPPLKGKVGDTVIQNEDKK